jgi:hypothetical protein
MGHLNQTQPGPARDLTEFWDEKFSRYLWHGAALALSDLPPLRPWWGSRVGRWRTAGPAETPPPC